jgi:hypothetical protein
MLLFVVCQALAFEFRVFAVEKRERPSAAPGSGTQKLPVTCEHSESSKRSGSAIGVDSIASEFLAVVGRKTAKQFRRRVACTKLTKRKSLPDRMTFTRHPEIRLNICRTRNPKKGAATNPQPEQQRQSNDKPSGFLAEPKVTKIHWTANDTQHAFRFIADEL